MMVYTIAYKEHQENRKYRRHQQFPNDMPEEQLFERARKIKTYGFPQVEGPLYSVVVFKDRKIILRLED